MQLLHTVSHSPIVQAAGRRVLRFFQAGSLNFTMNSTYRKEKILRNSRVLKKLRNGEHVLTAAIGRVPDPWLAEVVGHIGYDVIWYDLEHRSFSEATIDPIALACRATDIDLMVRVRKSGYDMPMRALEFGATGIMVPHIRSAEEARQWVEWCKFPPMGKRGLDGAGADALHGLDGGLDYLRQANEETFLVVQIEDKEAVECVEEIAAVPGVDLLFVGPGDLSLSYGVPLDFTHPLLVEATLRVAAAAKAAGKWWGTVSGTPEAAQLALDRGARMVVGGVDHVLLLRGFKQAFDDYSKISIKD
jgi:4-hydroxy-2-oxoheptanedioate aldolase